PGRERERDVGGRKAVSAEAEREPKRTHGCEEEEESRRAVPLGWEPVPDGCEPPDREAEESRDEDAGERPPPAGGRPEADGDELERGDQGPDRGAVLRMPRHELPADQVESHEEQGGHAESSGGAGRRPMDASASSVEEPDRQGRHQGQAVGSAEREQENGYPHHDPGGSLREP